MKWNSPIYSDDLLHNVPSKPVLTISDMIK